MTDNDKQYISEENEFAKSYALERSLTTDINMNKFRITFLQAILEVCQSEPIEEVNKAIYEMVAEFSRLVHKAKNLGE